MSSPTSRHDDCCRARSGELIGDDLGDADLDALWDVFTGNDPGTESTAPGWWADKPHQIAYRLLLRLTRAENRVAELEGC